MRLYLFMQGENFLLTEAESLLKAMPKVYNYTGDCDIDFEKNFLFDFAPLFNLNLVEFDEKTLKNKMEYWKGVSNCGYVNALVAYRCKRWLVKERPTVKEIIDELQASLNDYHKNHSYSSVAWLKEIRNALGFNDEVRFEEARSVIYVE